MSAFQYLLRFFIDIIKQPGVQAVLTETGREVSRAATKKLVREVQNGFSRYENKRSPRVVS